MSSSMGLSGSLLLALHGAESAYIYTDLTITARIKLS